MKPGLQHDDIWVMVEDELLQTAKLYTQHLHRAEYLRLKQAAKTQSISQSAARRRSRTVSRPVNGKLSHEAKVSHEAQEREDKQQAVLLSAKARGKLPVVNREDDEDDLSDAPFMLDPHLRSLMRRRTPASVALSNVTGARKSNTRAAVGFTGPKRAAKPSTAGGPSARKSGLAGLASDLGMKSRSEAEEESDDLDAIAPVRKAIRTRSPNPTKRTREESASRQPARRKSPSPKRMMTYEEFKAMKNKKAEPRIEPLTAPRFMGSDRGGLPGDKVSSRPVSRSASRQQDLSPKKAKSSVAQQIAQKRAARAARAKEEQEETNGAKKKRISLDEIPTFMF